MQDYSQRHRRDCVQSLSQYRQARGEREVNIEIIKTHTNNSGNYPDYDPDTQLIKMNWQFMDDIYEDEKQRFIKLCCISSACKSKMKHILKRSCVFDQATRQIKSKYDKPFPKVDTCSFKISFLKYSNFELIKKKILMAINMDYLRINTEKLSK